MSDYTPSTERVRADYIHGVGGTTWYEGKADAIGVVFDRWLSEVIRKAKYEAWDEGYVTSACDVITHSTPNPYRQGEQE